MLPRSARLVLAILMAFGLVAPVSSQAVLEVRGRVVDDAGIPIARAAVELAPLVKRSDRYRRLLAGEVTPEPTVAVETSADGRYLLQAPEPGMWQLLIRSRHRIPVRRLLVPLTADLDLPDALLRTDAGVEMQVLDGTGQPIPKAQVLVWPVEDSRRRGALSGWRERGSHGFTDEKGMVTLSRTPGTQLQVAAWAPGFVASEKATITGASGVLRLAAGKIVTLRFLAPGGEPLADALVGVDGWSWIGGFTDGDGKVDVATKPGEPFQYGLQEPAGASYRGSLELDSRYLQGQERPVEEILLPAPVDLEASVIDGTSRAPVTGAFVWSGRDPGHFVRAGADGGYRLRDYPHSDLRLGAGAAGYQTNWARLEAAGAGVSDSGEDRTGAPTMVLSPSAALTGRVVDEVGEGIASAEIQARRPDTWRHPSVSAREDGSFRFEDLEPGETYELVARAPGFADAKKTLKLTGGVTVELELARGRSLIGTLVDEFGAPVVGGEVVLVPIVRDFRRRFRNRGLKGPEPAMTDKDGAFQVLGLGTEPMALLARAEGFADRMITELGLDGDEELVDAGEIVLERGVALRGVVRDESGSAVESARVSAHMASFMRFMVADALENSNRTAVSDADGEFAIEGLGRAEPLRVYVQHEQYLRRELVGVLPDEEEPLEIVLEEAARVSGRVENESGRPVSGAMVSAKPLSQEGKLSSQFDNFDRDSAWARTAQDGSFTMTGARPGEVEVSVEAAGYLPAEPVRLTLTAGEERTGTVIVVRRGGSLEGRVVNSTGEAVAGASVSIAREQGTVFSSRRSRLAAKTDADGRFRVEGLDPAERRLVLQVNHPDYVSFEERFRFEPGLERLVVLETGATVSGFVLTEAEEPVGGADVALVAASGFSGRGEPTTTSLDDGSFEISGVEAGTYELSASGAGFARSIAEAPVEVRTTAVRGLTIYLERGGTIRGSILGLETEELSQLQIMVMAGRRPGGIGLVDSQGEYRITNVGAEEGLIVAMSPVSGRQVQEPFELDIAGGETRVDLEFPTGYRLSGTVRLDDQPWGGAMVAAQAGPSLQGGSQTDQDGRFEIQGLADGVYRLSVIDRGGGGAPHVEMVEIRGDTEIDIDARGVRIAGRVVAADTAEPLRGASVLVEAQTTGLWGAGSIQTSTSASGEYELRLPVAGEITVRARAQGYSESATTVSTAFGDQAGIDFELETAADLDLGVVLWSGVDPHGVHLAIVDEAGQRVLAQYVRPVGGRYRITTIPPGRWGLVAKANESAVVRIPIEVPGPPVDVVLPQEARIEVNLDAIAEQAGLGKLRVRSFMGVPLEMPRFDSIQTEWPVFGTRTAISGVPPGEWVVEFASDAGRVWQTPVTAIAGESVEAKLE